MTCQYFCNRRHLFTQRTAITQLNNPKTTSSFTISSARMSPKNIQKLFKNLCSPYANSIPVQYNFFLISIITTHPCWEIEHCNKTTTQILTIGKKIPTRKMYQEHVVNKFQERNILTSIRLSFHHIFLFKGDKIQSSLFNFKNRRSCQKYVASLPSQPNICCHE